jgi:hypothetical protein
MRITAEYAYGIHGLTTQNRISFGQHARDKWTVNRVLPKHSLPLRLYPYTYVVGVWRLRQSRASVARPAATISHIARYTRDSLVRSTMMPDNINNNIMISVYRSGKTREPTNTRSKDNTNTCRRCECCHLDRRLWVPEVRGCSCSTYSWAGQYTGTFYSPAAQLIGTFSVWWYRGRATADTKPNTAQ